MRYLFPGLAAIAALACAPLRADEIDVQPGVQVTASRVAETVDETLADVSVISRAEIEASLARDVLDLLRLEAGVELYRTGGPGAQTSLFLRGTNTNQVLVLIDGVRAAAATTGAYAFEHLPLDAVERIEVVRGPRASYWGADALGGVIQVFTRRLAGPRVAVGAGSWGEAAGSAGTGAWDGGNGWSVLAGARHVGGFSSTNADLCNGPDDPFCSFDPDDDGYRNTSLAARAAQAIGSQRLSATLYRSQGQAEFDQGYSNVIQQTAGVELEGGIGTDWSHRLGFGNTREDLATPVFGAHYRTRRSSLLWQNEIRLGEQQRLVAGIDLAHESGETRDTFTGTARYHQGRDNRALFAGWRATSGAFDSELSLRHDDNSAYGGATTGSLALGWRAGDALRAYASFGQGFRSPTMNELYDPGYDGWYAGNPLLAPERSHSSEFGLAWTPAQGQRVKASLYSTRVRDLISFTGPQNQALNIAHAVLDGAELGYERDGRDWSLQATWTYQDARDGDTGEPLLRRARHKATARLERHFGERFTAGAELMAVDRRADTGGRELPGYALLDLRARWRLDHGWSAGARLGNATNRDYALVRGYNTPGRSLFVEIGWQP
jgi:vitamin B12 transporter